jgi:hypothetical protein
MQKRREPQARIMFSFQGGSRTDLRARSRFEFSLGRRLSKSHNPASESVV